LPWIAGVPAFAHMPAGEIGRLVEWMLEKEILWDDQGILWLGREGQDTYGRRNFLELFSVFMSPPLFSVLHGRQELGFVDEMSFLEKKDGPRVLLLGGRGWHVTHIDWQRRVAYVEATDQKGRSRWKGQGRGLGYRLCQAIKHVLATNEDRQSWSTRARHQIEEARRDFAWLGSEGSVVIIGGSGEAEWWTFAGAGANAALANELAQITRTRSDHDSLSLTLQSSGSAENIEAAIAELRARDAAQMQPEVDEQAIAGLKFNQCLPPEIAVAMLQARLRDAIAIETVLREPVRFVVF
jgi:ATP-dependent Lhr-like helicase